MSITQFKIRAREDYTSTANSARLGSTERRQTRLVPIWRDILLDTDSAVSAFAKLRKGPFSFILESAPAGSETWARYTFMGTEPRAAWRLNNNVVEDWTPALGWHNARQPANALDDLEAILETEHPSEVAELEGFWSGIVGYFGYDVVRLIESLENPPLKALDVPEALFVFTRSLVIIDNLKGQARVVVTIPVPMGLSDYGSDSEPESESESEPTSESGSKSKPEPESTAHSAFESEMDRLYAEAETELEDIIARLRSPSPLLPLTLDHTVPPAVGTSSISKPDFLKGVDQIKEYIKAGDCFQGLIARRIETPHDFSSETLYRALRVLNPSPYMFHLILDGIELVGSSPELLVRLSDQRVTVRPIAGTRKRGKSAEEDAELSADLLSDEKERAEHVMLIDLGRNDVGRISEFGSVEVTDFMCVEKYSHVLHIVSQVEGYVRDEASALDVFKATFPAGTMTGAPKVRAMEIIDELEPVRRGPYAGALGYIASGGKRMDLAITIRTCTIANGVASVQAGAGIVADSIPEMEWEETENKARAMLSAIGQAKAAR